MAELNNVFSQISAQFKSMDGFVQRARGFPVVPSWLVSSKYKSFFTLKKKSLAPTSSDSLQLPPQLPNMEERGVFSPAVLSNILLLSSISQSQRMHGGHPGIQITAVWKISSKRLQKNTCFRPQEAQKWRCYPHHLYPLTDETKTHFCIAAKKMPCYYSNLKRDQKIWDIYQHNTGFCDI